MKNDVWLIKKAVNARTLLRIYSEMTATGADRFSMTNEQYLGMKTCFIVQLC